MSRNVDFMRFLTVGKSRKMVDFRYKEIEYNDPIFRQQKTLVNFPDLT